MNDIVATLNDKKPPKKKSENVLPRLSGALSLATFIVLVNEFVPYLLQQLKICYI